MNFACTPQTKAETLAVQQVCGLQYPPAFPPLLRAQNGFFCGPSFGNFETEYDEDFALDRPVLRALLPELVANDTDRLAQFIAAAVPPPAQPKNAGEADKWFAEASTAVFGKENLTGNASSVFAAAEAKLRAVFVKKALTDFERLRSGAVQSIVINRNLTLYSHRVSTSGAMSRGAQIRVRVARLPLNVVHPMASGIRITGSAGASTLRVSARNVHLFGAAADTVASARMDASRLLRGARSVNAMASKGGGAVLAFGPTAGFDFYDSYTTQNGAAAVGKDFALRSAKSQSGNLVGFAAGLAAAKTVAVGVALVGVTATGWPVILIALGAGVVAQTVWNATDMDDWSQAKAAQLFD